MREVGARTYGPELTHRTEKLSPLPDSAEGDAFVAPPLVTIVIWCTLAPNEPIVPVVPLIEASHELNETVPKFAKGSTPPLEGASATHSADER